MSSKFLISKKYSWHSDAILREWQPLRTYSTFREAIEFVHRCNIANPDASFAVDIVSNSENKNDPGTMPILLIEGAHDNVK